MKSPGQIFAKIEALREEIEDLKNSDAFVQPCYLAQKTSANQTFGDALGWVLGIKIEWNE